MRKYGYFDAFAMGWRKAFVMNTPVLFSTRYVNLRTVPSGLYIYYVKSDNGEPVEIGTSFYNDYYGVVISQKPLDLFTDEYRDGRAHSPYYPLNGDLVLLNGALKKPDVMKFISKEAKWHP